MTTEHAEDKLASASEAGPIEKACRNPRFLYYFVMWDPGRPPKIVEAIMVARHGPDPKRVLFDTGIVIPATLHHRMRASAVEEEVKAFCVRVRMEITRSARIRVARNVGGDAVIARHRYRLGDDVMDAELSPNDIPREIADIIGGDAEFERNPTYMRWYWQYLDRKRDEIISKELQKHYASNEEVTVSP